MTNWEDAQKRRSVFAGHYWKLCYAQGKVKKLRCLNKNRWHIEVLETIDLFTTKMMSFEWEIHDGHAENDSKRWSFYGTTSKNRNFVSYGNTPQGVFPCTSGQWSIREMKWRRTDQYGVKLHKGTNTRRDSTMDNNCLQRMFDKNDADIGIVCRRTHPLAME